MSLSESAREQIKRMLLANFSLEKIIMFGSQARGTADKRSDVDLLVISNVNKDKFILAREIREALLKLDYAFDIVTFTPEEYDKEKEIPGTVSRYAQKKESYYMSPSKEDAEEAVRLATKVKDVILNLLTKEGYDFTAKNKT